MNQYLKNLQKIEFVVTLACTGRCKHCSEGGHTFGGPHIEASAAVRAVRQICAHYDIATVMTFGGEPLLYPETVCAVHSAAAELGVAKRQVITNCFFSKDPVKIETVVRSLAACGVNDLLLSVDAFHQETVPLQTVLFFAECAVNANIPVRLSPAWLVSREDNNPWNLRTREILSAFARLPIPVGQGNIVFPKGNALKYLGAYFSENNAVADPYDEDPENVTAISIAPDGGVLNGNVYGQDILEILEAYRP